MAPYRRQTNQTVAQQGYHRGARLAKRYGINEKVAVNWPCRLSVEDMPMGLKKQGNTVLSPME